MTDTELIDALAARLYIVVTDALDTALIKVPDIDRRLIWRTAAVECLRQMKWARYGGYDADRDRPFDVELAAPGWIP